MWLLGMYDRQITMGPTDPDQPRPPDGPARLEGAGGSCPTVLKVRVDDAALAEAGDQAEAVARQYAAPVFDHWQGVWQLGTPERVEVG